MEEFIELERREVNGRGIGKVVGVSLHHCLARLGVGGLR